MRSTALLYSLSLFSFSLLAVPASAQAPLLHIEEEVEVEVEVAARSEEPVFIETARERRLIVEEPVCTNYCRRNNDSFEEDPIGWVGLGAWMGSVDLDQWEVLGWGASAVSAIDASQLGSFGTHLLGGMRIGGRLQSLGFLRGPEYQLTVIGAELDGAWMPAGAEGLEVRGLQLTSLGFSIAGGVQLPFGPLRPYALLRLGLRLGFLDVGLRHSELGTLGSETLLTGAVQAGAEVGVEWIIDDEVGLQLAVTLDPASGAYGGALSVVFDAED